MQGSPYDDSFNGGEDAVIAKIVGCGVNDFCDPSTAFGSLFLDIERDSVYTQGCNATASPGPLGEGGCFDFPAATVWYRFTPETDWDCIKIALISEELPQPQMAVFEGDCPQNMASLPFACDSGTGGESTIHMGVEAGITYYLAVSDATGAEGYFDLYLENSPADALAVDVVANDLQCFESGDGIIDLSVNNSTGVLHYDWNTDELDGTRTINTLAIGTYLITVTDENNCVDRTDTITISQPDQIFVSLELDAESNTILYGDTITAIAVPSIDEEAVGNTSWFPDYHLGDTTTARLLEQPITPLFTDEMIVMLEDTSGCIAMDTTLIIVSTDFPYYVPNVFAPGSPHPENAVFRPFGTHKIEQVNFMRVFNRWGTLVYERTNFPIDDDSAGWDGRLNGHLLEPGVYVYSLEMRFIDGSVRQYAGDVTLIR